MSDADAPGGEDAEFDSRGWVLVAVILVAFLLAPALIYFNPFGLPFRFAYLVLPLIPAVLLGLTAVWVAVTGSNA